MTIVFDNGRLTVKMCKRCGTAFASLDGGDLCDLCRESEETLDVEGVCSCARGNCE